MSLIRLELDIDISPGITVQMFQNTFIQSNHIEYVSVNGSVNKRMESRDDQYEDEDDDDEEGDEEEVDFQPCYDSITNDKKVKRAHFGDLHFFFNEMSLESRDCFQQAFSKNSTITHFDANYSFFHTTKKSTDIISQNLIKFRLFSDPYIGHCDEFDMITDSIIDIIQGNTHPNLKLMNIEFMVSSNKQSQLLKQRLMDALKINTTLDTFYYSIAVVKKPKCPRNLPRLESTNLDSMERIPFKKSD